MTEKEYAQVIAKNLKRIAFKKDKLSNHFAFHVAYAPQNAKKDPHKRRKYALIRASIRAGGGIRTHTK